MDHTRHKHQIVLFYGKYDDGDSSVTIEVQRIYRKTNSLAYCEGLDGNVLLIVNTGVEILYTKDFKKLV